jgi:hypothetical protein
LKHVCHRGNAGNIPRTQVAVKHRVRVKQTLHYYNPGDIPQRDVVIESRREGGTVILEDVVMANEPIQGLPKSKNGPRIGELKGCYLAHVPGCDVAVRGFTSIPGYYGIK